MKVKEIMSKDVSRVQPEDNAKDALAVLFKMQISGLPVIDKEEKLVGMFTEKEVLKQILPSYLDKVGRFVYEENPKSIGKKFQDLINMSVSQIMRREVISIDAEATLCEVARIMLTQKIRRIPVLDQEKKVMGIVSREDVIRAYAREAGWGID